MGNYIFTTTATATATATATTQQNNIIIMQYCRYDQHPFIFIFLQPESQIIH